MRQLPGPCRLSVATTAGVLELWLRSRVDRARTLARAGDTGASVVEWVIISALLVGIAVTVGAILLAKVRDKAESIDLGLGSLLPIERGAGDSG